jgi:glucosamine-6-phosphate deaminase
VVIEALKRIKTTNNKPQTTNHWINDCWLWLYKGAWQEWDITEIEMAMPMSPDQVVKKRHGIFIHQSQKDSVPFQGSDDREFWQRAEERNANTAKLYAQLGLTQYAAMEAFVRWKF